MDDNKYLTDYDWKSTQNSYKSHNKDKAISGSALRLTDENNQEVVYERGIGAHSTSTIIYDLSDKDYAYFTSYVGVDRANVMLEDKISSQEEINEMIKALNTAIENLEESIDLSEIINIEDKYLKASIKKELNLSSYTITVGDMQKITSLNVKGAESLNGFKS
ncbi:MAG: NPCBM/NEW2 domain-containing protein [Peptostreptococcaceae bacterium]|nr:NPCBM/NEW2 domain-containing protein [Peptostreptococcaceae bacterium]